jgi:hypothetical protein
MPHHAHVTHERRDEPGDEPQQQQQPIHLPDSVPEQTVRYCPCHGLQAEQFTYIPVDDPAQLLLYWPLGQAGQDLQTETRVIHRVRVCSVFTTWTRSIGVKGRI